MSDTRAVKKLLKLITKYKKSVIFIIVCLLLSTCLNLCIPLLSKGIMDLGFIGGDRTLLIELAIISALIYGMNSFIEIIREKERIIVSSKLEFELSKNAFAHLLRLKADFFDKMNYTEIYSNIYTDIANIILIADEGMFYIVTQIFCMAGGIIGLFIINQKLTLLVVLFIPCKCFAAKYIAKKRKIYTNKYISEAQNYAKWFGDTAEGIKEIKLFNISEFKMSEFKQKQGDVIDVKKQINMLGAWNKIIDVVMVQFLVMILYILGANLVFDLKLTIGSIFAFITYSNYVTTPISGIMNAGYMLSGIIPSTKRFYSFMDWEEEDDKGDILPRPGNLEFCNVRYAYENNAPVFNHLNLKFIKGRKTALIGKNGCGKSTLIGLLTRMYQPSEGEILLDHEDIWRIPLNKYRELFSVVSQQVYLFNDTIRSNICLYKNIAEADILKAIEDSGLKEFISEVTLDYIVGPNGSFLSGGQKQKIAIARALVQDRPIIIFDEATSNADTDSELHINDIIQTKMNDKTIILVSHKKDILSKVDNIVYIKENEVIQGSYEDLCRKDEEFMRMIMQRSYGISK